MRRKEHPIHHSSCYIVFYIHQNKTHKSRLKCEIKYDLYKIAQKIKPKNQGFLKPIFSMD